MTKKAKVQIPEARGPASDMAAAAQEAIQRIKTNALPAITEYDLDWNDPEAEVAKVRTGYRDRFVVEVAPAPKPSKETPAT